MILKVAMPGKVQFKLIRREPAFFMAHEGDIHYIGGADVLPAPLETEQENEVIQDLATEEYAQEARSILIEHNLRLVVYIAKKFDNTGVGVEDLISIGTIGLIKSINTLLTSIYRQPLIFVKTKLPRLINLVIKKDPGIERGGCKVESENCTVDATIASQFDIIRERVKGRLKQG